MNDLETEPNAVKGKKQSDKTIFVVVEDGRVQEVYACASLTGVEVEILDKDDAKVSEDAAWRSTLQRIAEVAEQYIDEGSGKACTEQEFLQMLADAGIEARTVGDHTEHNHCGSIRVADAPAVY